MEHRLHLGLQIRAHDHLGDPVCDGRHPEHSRAAVPLRDRHRTYRRREIAPRRQPVPELEQVPRKVLLELLDRLLIHAGRTLVRLDPPIGLPHGPLGDLKRLRLRLAHPTHPTSPRLIAKPARTTRPLRSSPITGPSTLIRDGPPLCPASLLSPSQFRCLGFSLRTTSRRPKPLHWPASHRGDRFPSSAQEPRPRSRHLHAGHRLASQQAPARLIPGQRLDPGFDVTDTLSTLHQWFAFARLRDPHLTR